jgi:hypothetical protein
MEPLEAELRRDWERWKATGASGTTGYQSFPATDSGVRPGGEYTGRRREQWPSARQEYLGATPTPRAPRPGGPSPLSGPMPGLIPPATSGWQQPPARPSSVPTPSAEYYGDGYGYGGNDRGYSSANGYNGGGYPHDYASTDPGYTSGNGYNGGGYAYGSDDPRYTSGNGYNGGGYAYDYDPSDGGYGGGSYDTGSYGTDSYRTGPRARGRQPGVMVADAPSPWQLQANSWAARSRGQTQPAWAEPASRGYPVPQDYNSPQGIMESPDGAPASMVARILSDADYQAAALTAITELASRRAALVTRQGLYEAAQVRDAAKREADEITQRAAIRASAVREAAELEAAETREAVTLMQAELAELASRITSTLPHPVLPRPAETSRRRA